ncbi:MAG TPA: tRNA (adenosine(37)-N6)-dimethylallyltransferase MiaA, partial [Cyclobacteriaceae bacterium]|nr:tRNA (adenosine(37)-N6)-dimethylallyltransferase MiaA [Cyclobacteriaceae bacterium]
RNKIIMPGTLIVIVGPTASGKTALAIHLATIYGTEIVSADSRQIYKELDIGTAKPTESELRQVRHHFIDTKSITEDYDAGTFAREARQVIDELFQVKKYVILCGGSGLYVKALLEGFDELPDVPGGIRTDIIESYNRNGLSWLQEEVRTLDPEYFEIVDRQNPQRLMRALEVIRSSGKPFSLFRKKEKIILPFNVVKIGLNLDRDTLYERIDTRMDKMISDGLFAEAEKFFTSRHLNALQTVGYQEIFGFMEGAYDREEAVRLLKRNSRHYAKRQMTWFRKDKEIEWFDPGNWEPIVAFINRSSRQN